MTRPEINPAKTGITVFAISLVIGLVLLAAFGKPAGLFSGGSPVDALTGSAAGWIALFGATLIIGSPIIGLTLWAVDRVVKKTLEDSERK
ncbi:MAG: hypothetical protein HY779_05115 [Rubrobacteridae bacterium]|nr:hypothetical protein [Rubrobacteridae bacterium]